jgi:hypothetical protein
MDNHSFTKPGHGPAGSSARNKNAGGARNGTQHSENANARQKRDKPAGSPQYNKRESGGSGKGKQHYNHNIEVDTYKCTDIYQRGAAAGFSNKQALDKFNVWVVASRLAIDPSKMLVCGDCGALDDFQLCDHFINVKSPNTTINDELIINAPLRTEYYWSYQIIDGIKRLLVWPRFDLGEQNNTMLGGFSNSDIDEDNIISPLFNHIKIRMHTSYFVNGKDDRALRLAHCQRIAQKWVESKKLKLDDDTVLTNRVMFTVQRVCDNAENGVLYEHTDPTANFLLARARSWAIFFWTLLLCALYTMVCKKFLTLTAPLIAQVAIKVVIPGALHSWMTLFFLMLRVLLHGSMQALNTLMIFSFNEIDVLAIYLAGISIFLYWASKRR